MTGPLIFSLPGNEATAEKLGAALSGELGKLETRRFPDEETYLRFATDPAGRSVVLVCSLNRPDPKFLRLAFAASAAKELGAARVGLVAPYLAYMRQDKQFHPGEAVSSVHFARLISVGLDWLATVDPHLHRHKSLDEIFPIPARVGHAAPLLAGWITSHVQRPLSSVPTQKASNGYRPWQSCLTRPTACFAKSDGATARSRSRFPTSARLPTASRSLSMTSFPLDGR